jgi:hypothetical protein
LATGELAFHRRDAGTSFGVLTKAERLRFFLERMAAARPVGSADQALALLAENLQAVENEFSGVPCKPDRWRTDGRMYAPQADSQVKCPGRPSLRKYRNKGHYVFIGINGSIRIENLEAKVLLDKGGQDGRKTHELDA